MNVVLSLLRIAGHLLAGTLTVLFLFPHLSAEERGRRVTAWAARMVGLAGVRVVMQGRSPAVRGKGALIVANHVSWLDIYVLHSLLFTRFISKAEIRHWPLIGWLAEMTGTLFLERTKRSDAARINREMAGHLQAGECLALFPEGTTTDGTEVKPFYASLFNPALEAEAQVWPVLIRYLDLNGEPTLAAAYHDDTTMAQSLMRVLRSGGIRAEVTFLPPIAATAGHRRELAQAAETAIRDALVRAGHGTAPEIPAHRPNALR
ncbi:MAG: 1-acyl-sn-glycerol-3-phosphate acyltransferase [Betaproteobacteria bacterium]|nr:1-acyl-sn-glycerol-3-phosphate acyltransferase [Betaproteobacteria bacterium]